MRKRILLHHNSNNKNQFSSFFAICWNHALLCRLFLRPIIVKLESGTANDLFLGFNRAVGPTQDNVQASDKVTIVQAGSDGRGYSQSYLNATLAQGQSFSISNWRDTEHELIIQVNEINTESSPGYADITISYGPQPTLAPTPKQPSKSPTSIPTSQPTHEPSLSPSFISNCGDALCSVDERPETCEMDCIDKLFTPKNAKNDANSNGHMFTINTKTEITIASFDVIAKKKGDTQVMVYTRAGDYNGHESDRDGWELIFDKTVKLDNKGLSNLGDLGRAIVVPAGSMQSFFIWAEKGLLYTKSQSNNNGASFASDFSIEANEGIGMNNLFDKATGTGQFSGGIRCVSVRFHCVKLSLCEILF